MCIYIYTYRYLYTTKYSVSQAVDSAKPSLTFDLQSTRYFACRLNLQAPTPYKPRALNPNPDTPKPEASPPKP